MFRGRKKAKDVKGLRGPGRPANPMRVAPTRKPRPGGRARRFANDGTANGGPLPVDSSLTDEPWKLISTGLGSPYEMRFRMIWLGLEARSAGLGQFVGIVGSSWILRTGTGKLQKNDCIVSSFLAWLTLT